jgi:hypothetical protein
MLSLCPLGCNDCINNPSDAALTASFWGIWPGNPNTNWIPIAYQIAVSPRSWELGYVKETNGKA